MISLRVTSGEAITSTVILNEKRSPDDKHRGSSLNINTPRKEWGDALRALISRRYGIDSQGSVCRKKARLATKLAITAASKKRAPQPVGALRLGDRQGEIGGAFFERSSVIAVDRQGAVIQLADRMGTRRRAC